MLSIFDSRSVAHCQGLQRRQFLQIGTMGGLSLTGLLAQQAQASTRKLLSDKSVVFLFLQGGPPQIETFDPKMDVPAAGRSCVGEVQTSMPSVLLGGTFPRLATMMDRLAIVRSFASGDGGHNQVPVLTGNNTHKATMGAVVARATGSINVRTGVPNHTVVIPESVAPNLKLGQPTGPFTFDYVAKNYTTGGKLGSQYEAFMPGGGEQLLKNLQLQLPRERFNDRRLLLAQVDSFKRQLERSGELRGADSFQQQAYDVLLRGVVDAFNINKEDKATLARYDTSHFFAMEDYHLNGKHYNKLRNQSRFTNLLGKQMLLARRLCEAGCRFVTVVDSCWDFHGDGNNPPTPVGMKALGPQLDHAVAAFLDDLHERGLGDKILLVITGEMGRSPNKGKNGGTGHHAKLTPLLVAGGGLRMGQVVGKSDRNGSEPTTERYLPEHLQATILHTLFDSGELRINPGLLPGAVSNMVLEGKPIAELFT